MTWQIAASVLVIAAAVAAIMKKFETRMVLLLAGLLMCVMGGNAGAAVQAFIKGMVNGNLVPPICAAMGFAAAVTFSKCDAHLVGLCVKPLRRVGGLLIPFATVLTFLVNIAIMSAAGTAATVGATFIPLLIRAGIRPAGAATAVGAGTMCGLLLNPGCAHDIYIAKLGESSVVEFIGAAAPYIVGLFLLSAAVTAVMCCLVYKDHKGGAGTPPDGSEAASPLPERISLVKAAAPLVPMAVLIVSTVFFPKNRIDVVAAMLMGLAYIAVVSLRNPNELVKSFFKGMGTGYASVIGLIVAAGVFAAGMQQSGLIPAFIEFLKGSNEVARWGASLGPFFMAVLTGSGEAAIWAFNQAVTPYAASFGMDPEMLGLLCALAGQFGRTASPLAGCIIIVAGMAKVSPFEITRRCLPGMAAAVIAAALLVV